MASILFLGYSNLVKGRILPILAKAGFSEVSIAKFAGQTWDDTYRECGLPVTCYDNYEDGLKHFRGDLVYVSTVNSTHVTYARKSLEAGFHTVIDKPATSSCEEARELVSIARSRGLLVGESTVYLCHPQLAAVDGIFARNGDAPKLLTVHFSMPPFLPGNFRYRKALGGGAIMDTSPYAASIGRYFFRCEPERVFCTVNERQEDGLDLAYSLLMQYPGGRVLIGHFGFNTEYVNRVFLLGNRTNVTVNRIFTIPDTLENDLTVNHLNETTTVRVPAGNNFAAYLQEVRKTLGEGDFTPGYEAMLSDAKVREMIIRSSI